MAAKEPCVACRSRGRDRAGNNFTNYGTGNGGFCFSCGYTILSDAERERKGLDEYIYDDEEVMTKELITPEEVEKLKEYTGVQGKMSRNIPDETYKAYAVRFKYSEETAEVVETFYPYTQDYKAAGYKIRMSPVKDFRSVGKIGKDSELFGQWKWKNGGGKYACLCSGELDALAAFTMLENYRKGRSSEFDAIPCVSSAIGESGAWKQVQAQYEWMNSYERIVVLPDMDDAGQKALKKLSEVIPKGKMFVVKLPLKDVGKMLDEGKEKQFIRAFYDAAPYSPDGILPSNGLTSKIIEGAMAPKVPLPPFMHKLQKMMAGGWPISTIMSLSSASGTGKSSIIEAMMLYWIFNSPYKVGIISLESDAGQLATKLLSSHIGTKIDLMETVEEKLEFLNLPDVQEKARNLWETDEGAPRFYLIEDRDGGIESIKEKIMQLIISCDVQVVLIDPYSDLCEGLTNEVQAELMRWLKGMVKSHKVSFGLVNHVRKSGNGQKANSTGAELHEEDIFGSSSIMKSCACNLLFMRDKESTDDVIRNTIRMKASKIRWTGNTGMAGEYYYDNNTSTLYDKDDWMQTQPATF